MTILDPAPFISEEGTDHASAPGVRAYELLRTAIRAGDFAPATRVPVDELSRATGIGHDAVLGATQRLARQGVVRIDSDGAVVAHPRFVQISVVDLALGDPSAPGRVVDGEFRVDEVEHRVVQSTPVIRARLDTDADRVLMVEQRGVFCGETLYVRVGYYAEDDPHRLSRAMIAEDVPPIAPMKEVFQRLFGAPLGSTSTSVHAVRSDPATATTLGIRAGTPVLLRESTIVDADGRPRTFSYTHYRADRVSLSDVTA